LLSLVLGRRMYCQQMLPELELLTVGERQFPLAF
jgi:hypothetical protein